MSAELKIKSKVKGTAVIDLGPRGSMAFEEITVYQNEWSETDMILLIVDKNDPNNKIQLTFSKPAEFIEVKPPDVKEETSPPKAETVKPPYPYKSDETI
jgi:hypothetical protein